MMRRSHRVTLALLMGVWMFGLSGCASLAGLSKDDVAPSGSQSTAAQQTMAASVSAEQQVLTLLGEAVAGDSIALHDGVSAIPDQSYPAASGRLCRWVALHYPDGAISKRLACSADSGWQWSAAVLRDSGR